MSLLRHLSAALALLTSYVLLVKGALATGASGVALLALCVLTALVLEAFAHRERVHGMHAATDAHQKAQADLLARVKELDKSVKSLTNVVGSGERFR